MKFAIARVIDPKDGYVIVNVDSKSLTSDKIFKTKEEAEEVVSRLESVRGCK